MKDNKYKITIDKVICESAYVKEGYNCVKIDAFEGENFPEIIKYSYNGLPKNKMIILMKGLRKALESIINSNTGNKDPYIVIETLADLLQL